MKLTGYGKREWLGGGVFTIIFIVVSIACTRYDQVLFCSFAAIIGILYIAIAVFFRDPLRKISEDQNVLVAPSDGVIDEVELLKDADENQFFEGNDTIRIGISTSLFNVHINRAPCDIKIKEKQCSDSSSHDARKLDAARESESITISCFSTLEKKFPIIIRQISKKMAKQIVCTPEPGDRLTKGESFGMIKSGSRTELYLPAATWMVLTVKSGDKVKAGETVVAKLVEQNRNKD